MYYRKNLQIKPQKRAEFAKNIKSHQFFETINWQDLLELKIEPPFLPKINETSDVRNFDTVIIFMIFFLFKLFEGFH